MVTIVKKPLSKTSAKLTVEIAHTDHGDFVLRIGRSDDETLMRVIPREKVSLACVLNPALREVLEFCLGGQT